MRRSFLLCLGLLTLAWACSSSDPTPASGSQPPSSSSDDGGGLPSTTPTPPKDGGADAADAAKDAASAHVELDGGCVTYEGASQLCGFKSDESICAKSVSCGTSTDVSQCKINCEMGATTRCYTQADVDCLTKAVASGSCSALKACGWIL